MTTAWQYTDAANAVVVRTNDNGSMESRSINDPVIAAFVAGGGALVAFATALEIARAAKQRSLDSLFDANFDLSKFIRGGTVANVTAANVGAFLAQITNNYRSIRASISGAADVAALNTINVNVGWPNNP